MQRRDRMRGTALRDHFARAPFALTALGRNTKLELDVIEAPSGPDMAGDITVGNPLANTDDHDGGKRETWLAVGALIINTNLSHLQPSTCLLAGSLRIRARIALVAGVGIQPGNSCWRPISAGVAQPHRAIATSNSSRSRRSTWATPTAPAFARP